MPDVLGIQVQAVGAEQTKKEIEDVEKAISSTDESIKSLASNNSNTAKSLKQVSQGVEGVSKSVASTDKIIKTLTQDNSANAKTLRQLSEGASLVSSTLSAMDNASNRAAGSQENLASAAQGATSALEKQSTSALTNIERLQGYQALGQIFSSVGNRINAFARDSLTAYNTVEQVGAQLKMAIGSAEEAQKALATLRSESDKWGTGITELGSAGQVMAKLGVDINSNIRAVEQLAQGTGQDLATTAEIFSQAILGESRALVALRKQYGVSTADLQKYGVELTKSGKIANDTTDQQEKLRQALIALSNEKFGNSLAEHGETYAGAVENLANKIEEVKATFGESLAPTLTDIANHMSGLIDWFRTLDPELQKTAAVTTATAGAMAVMGSKALTVGAQIGGTISGLKNLGVQTDALTGKVKNLFSAMGSKPAVFVGAVEWAAIASTLALIFGTLSDAAAQQERWAKAEGESITLASQRATAGKAEEQIIIGQLKSMGYEYQNLDEIIKKHGQNTATFFSQLGLSGDIVVKALQGYVDRARELEDSSRHMINSIKEDYLRNGYDQINGMTQDTNYGRSLTAQRFQASSKAKAETGTEILSDYKRQQKARNEEAERERKRQERWAKQERDRQRQEQADAAKRQQDEQRKLGQDVNRITGDLNNAGNVKLSTNPYENIEAYKQALEVIRQIGEANDAVFDKSEQLQDTYANQYEKLKAGLQVQYEKARALEAEKKADEEIARIEAQHKQDSTAGLTEQKAALQVLVKAYQDILATDTQIRENAEARKKIEDKIADAVEKRKQIEKEIADLHKTAKEKLAETQEAQRKKQEQQIEEQIKKAKEQGYSTRGLEQQLLGVKTKGQEYAEQQIRDQYQPLIDKARGDKQATDDLTKARDNEIRMSREAFDEETKELGKTPGEIQQARQQEAAEIRKVATSANAGGTALDSFSQKLRSWQPPAMTAQPAPMVQNPLGNGHFTDGRGGESVNNYNVTINGQPVAHSVISQRRIAQDTATITQNELRQNSAMTSPTGA